MPDKNPVVFSASGAKPESRPPGWWSLNGDTFQGSRAGVAQAIAEAKDVPDQWKARLAEDIAALDPKYNFVKVNAHSSVRTTADGKSTIAALDYDISAQVKL